MYINKKLLITPLFAILPSTITSTNVPQQLRTTNNIITLEQSPEYDVVQIVNENNETKTIDSSALLEIFGVLSGLGLFMYMANAFNDMEKSDRQDYVDGMRRGR